MQLHIRHETRYVYEETVSYSIQSLKLTPRAERGQRVLSWRITSPGERLEQIDPYGNVTHFVTMEAPHREMRIVVEGIADIAPDDAGNRTMPPLDGELSPLAFLAPTALTRANGRLREIAERHLGRHPASRATLLDLVAGVRNAVEYEPGITDVSHSAAEVLDLGFGVCQDQAHVFVACCRAAGIPARYVSGYFYTGDNRRSREPRLGRCLDRRRRGLAEPGRHAWRSGRRRALPAGGRPRLSRRGAGARRAPRRRPRATERRGQTGRIWRRPRLHRPVPISNSEHRPPGSRLAAASLRAYHSYPHRTTGSHMTYCVAMLLDAGLVFLSDSRTNAGVDQINTFRKTTVFERAGDRVIVLMSAGNLAITQGALNLLAERMSSQSDANLLNCPNLFEAARCVGSTLREMHQRDAEALRQQGIEFNASFILGGQIKGEAPRLFHIYAAGNFVEATPDTTYFQIGESKYGKPIIDRVTRRSMPLSEAAKCALISMDSTIRSNLSVGLPLDLVIVRRDECRISSHVDIDSTNEYFQRIRERWGEALREIFSELPNPDWLMSSPPEAGRLAPPPSRLQSRAK